MLVRAGLHHDAKGKGKVTVTTTTRARPPAKPKYVPLRDRVYYRIRSGDTLDLVAVKFNTNVHQLLRWNPGIDAHSLHPGQRIRVK